MATSTPTKVLVLLSRYEDLRTDVLGANQPGIMPMV